MIGSIVLGSGYMLTRTIETMKAKGMFRREPATIEFDVDTPKGKEKLKVKIDRSASKATVRGKINCQLKELFEGDEE